MAVTGLCSAAALCSLTACSRPVFPWLLEKGGTPRRETFRLFPVPAQLGVLFLLPCLSSFSCPPCWVSESFLHQSKERPQDIVKRVPSVATGQPCATGLFKFLASGDWSVSLGKIIMKV